MTIGSTFVRGRPEAGDGRTSSVDLGRLEHGGHIESVREKCGPKFDQLTNAAQHRVKIGHVPSDQIRPPLSNTGPIVAKVGPKLAALSGSP